MVPGKADPPNAREAQANNENSKRTIPPPPLDMKAPSHGHISRTFRHQFIMFLSTRSHQILGLVTPDCLMLKTPIMPPICKAILLSSR